MYAPVKVATPPSDAYIGLSLLENGEIRHYNYGEQAESGVFCLFSTDKGLTWKKKVLPKEMPYADVQSPRSGEYLRVISMSDKGCTASALPMASKQEAPSPASRRSLPS